MRGLAVGALVLMLGIGSVRAQSPAVPVQPYSEIEQLKIQNVNLEGAIVQRAVQDWQAKVAALKADLESRRPGWTFEPASGTWAAVPKVEKE